MGSVQDFEQTGSHDLSCYPSRNSQKRGRTLPLLSLFSKEYDPIAQLLAFTGSLVVIAISNGNETFLCVVIATQCCRERAGSAEHYP